MRITAESRTVTSRRRRALARPAIEAGEDPPRLRGGGGDAEHALHTRHTHAHAHGATLASIDAITPRATTPPPPRDELGRAGRGVQQALDVGPALEAIGGVGRRSSAREVRRVVADRSTRSRGARAWWRW